jgi:hypothetical protein
MMFNSRCSMFVAPFSLLLMAFLVACKMAPTEPTRLPVPKATAVSFQPQLDDPSLVSAEAAVVLTLVPGSTPAHTELEVGVVNQGNYQDITIQGTVRGYAGPFKVGDRIILNDLKFGTYMFRWSDDTKLEVTSTSVPANRDYRYSVKPVLSGGDLEVR